MTAKGSIAFVANTSWSIYKFRLYLIERLLHEGFAIYVLAPRDAYTEKFEAREGLTYIELHHFHGKSISPLQDFRLYRELLRHYRRLKPGLIFHYTVKANLYGTMAASRTRIPAVSVITGLGYAFASKGWLNTLVRFGYKTALRHSKEVWVLNEDDRETLAAMELVPSERVFVLPGEGVDTTEFYASPYTIGNKAVTFLFIGRMIRHKGILDFVQACRLLREQGRAIRCQLLGFFDDNPAAIPRAQVEEWHREGIIVYLGHTDQVAGFIAGADCIVLPSYYREGLPMSLLEAASMSKALIAADTPGCRSLIEEGVNGYLCREKDSADLAEKMAAYCDLTPDAKTHMGIEGRHRVLQYFTREIVTAIYLDKINTLLPTVN